MVGPASVPVVLAAGRRPHPVCRKAALSGKLAHDTVFGKRCDDMEVFDAKIAHNGDSSLTLFASRCPCSRIGSLRSPNPEANAASQAINEFAIDCMGRSGNGWQHHFLAL